MKTANEALIDYIMNLTTEQVKAILDNWGILLHVIEMDTNEAIYTKRFLDLLFGEVKS